MPPPAECSRCGTALDGADRAGSWWSQVRDVRITTFVTEYVLPLLACPCCGKINAAQPPPWAHPGSISYGPGINTTAVLLSRLTGAALTRTGTLSPRTTGMATSRSTRTTHAGQPLDQGGHPVQRPPLDRASPRRPGPSPARHAAGPVASATGGTPSRPVLWTPAPQFPHPPVPLIGGLAGLWLGSGPAAGVVHEPGRVRRPARGRPGGRPVPGPAEWSRPPRPALRRPRSG